MSNNSETPVPEVKIYKDKAFWVGTYLGGPLVAGYLFAENFKALGQSEKTKSTWIITGIATLIIFGGIFLIPEDVNIPNFIIPLTYTALAYGLFKKYQSEKAEAHIQQGGEVYGWGRLILVGIIGLLITSGPIFAVAYLSEGNDRKNLTTKSYGQHQIEFDTTMLKESEIDNIAEGFINAGFFDNAVPKFVCVSKTKDTYHIYLSVIEGIEKNKLALVQFKTLRLKLEDHLQNYKVEFKLVVDHLDNVVKVLK